MALARQVTLGGALSRAFAAAIAPSGAPTPEVYAGLIGVEHEFTVQTVGGEQVDFRQLIHRLPIDGRRLDPGDQNAYRCSWGGVFTADAKEAELATPPIARRAGFSDELVGMTELGRTRLAAALPGNLSLRGYSTHISVCVPDRLVDAAARLYAERFAPALMLLMDQRDSPGLIVRPRPGRLELCGEYVAGRQLGAVAVFAAATVGLVCRALTGDEAARRSLPPRVRARVVDARIRRGLFIDRRAFGADLYSGGRQTRLSHGLGRQMTAQAHLESAWAGARAYATDMAAGERELVDRRVDGREALPIEIAAGARAEELQAESSATEIRASAPEPLLHSYRRPGYGVRAAIATWDFAVFALSAGNRRAYATVPRPAVGTFLEQLDRGRLDGVLASFLARPAADRVLAAREQTSTPGLHDSLGNARRLLPTERLPSGGGPLGDRQGKRQDSQQSSTPSTPVARPLASRPTPLGLGPTALVAVVAAVILLAAGAILVAAVVMNSRPTATAGAVLPSAPGVVPSTPTVPPDTPSAIPSVLPTPSARVDLSAVDACTLLDEQAVQELTGTSLGFAGFDQSQGPNFRGCFWPATTPVPPYVEISIDARPDGLAGFTGTASNWDCTTSPVAGVGTEAVGGSCIPVGSSQVHVYLTAWDKGVRVTLIVNEPERTLEPDDIGATVQSILERLASPVAPTAPGASPSPGGTSRHILELGDTATRNGDTLTATAVAVTSILCYPGSSIPDYTPEGCRKGETSGTITPPMMLIEVTYCVGADNVPVAVADPDAYGYAIQDIWVGSDNSSTGLGGEANSLYYGGEIVEEALAGTISPGECRQGFLPFSGPSHTYMKWGEDPDAADAAWWSLAPAAACPFIDRALLEQAVGVAFEESRPLAVGEQVSGCKFPVAGTGLADGVNVTILAVPSSDCGGATPCPLASVDDFRQFYSTQADALPVAGVGLAAYWYDAFCVEPCMPPFGAPDPLQKRLHLFRAEAPSVVYISLNHLPTDPSTWQAAAIGIAGSVGTSGVIVSP